MKKTLLVAIPAFLVACNSGTGSDSTLTDQSYETKVLSVEEMEKADPSKFLDAEGTYNENFWGNKLKIHGDVTNNATVANYKDVVIEVTFFTKTETVLDKQRYIIYDFFPAHQTKNFEMKIDRPDNCEKLGWKAVAATPY